MLNPASVFALTELVIEPSVLLTAVPPAFQFQATYVYVFVFTNDEPPNEKPSESKEVKEVPDEPSSSVVSVSKYSPVHLMTSKTL